MWSVDGLSWPYPCDIERVAEVTPSEISGMLLDRTYFNDVLGTYMKYSVKVVVPLDRRDEYAPIYELLSNPVGDHTFVLPYSNDTITVVGRVANVSDVYVRLPNNRTYWKGMSFEVVANHPSKQLSLGEAIARGRAPLPDIAEPAIGAIYEYTAYGWVPSEYQDADNIEY